MKISDQDQNEIIKNLRAELVQKNARIAALEKEIAVLNEKHWLFEGCRDD